MAIDRWDKAEIAGKVAGAVLIPVTLAVAAWFVNTELTARGQAARMTEIAVGVLTLEPSEDPDTNDPLRDWAIEVLQNPSDPPPLSDEAAEALRTKERLSVWGSADSWDDGSGNGNGDSDITAGVGSGGDGCLGCAGSE